jgi:hypothetical protein
VTASTTTATAATAAASIAATTVPTSATTATTTTTTATTATAATSGFAAATTAEVTSWQRSGRNNFGEHLARHRGNGQLATDVSLDIRQGNHVLLAAETDCIAFGARASGTTDAMDVIFRILRQIVVEDVTHIGNVQAA